MWPACLRSARLIAGEELQALHAREISVQGPDEGVLFRRERADEEIGETEVFARVTRAVHPFIDELPGAGSGKEYRQHREQPPETAPVLPRSAGKDLDADRRRKRHEIGVEERPQTLRFLAFGSTKSGDPNGRVNGDEQCHLRRRGRRRERGMSISSRTDPRMLFSSSMRRLRMSSWRETTTVSVLDLNPSRRRASSMRGSGISSVVRIQMSLFHMPQDV